MRKLIAIGGQPATGKTSMMKRFMAETADWQKQEPEKLVVAMYSANQNLYVLGDFSDPDEKFPGTDRLSMAVQPNAIKFLQSTTSNILFEGDRLFTASYLEAAADLADAGQLDLKIWVIVADPQIVAQRHIDRADTQGEQFLKGRITKYSNIQSSLVLMPFIEAFKNNNLGDRERIVKRLNYELQQ
ncbi:MAG: P-loop-containing protein [Candidatus Dormibacteria bacterium]